MCTMYHLHGHKRLDDDASLDSEKRQCCVLDALECHPVEALGCRPVETQENRPGTTCTSVHVWQWPLSKKVVTTICPLHYDTKSEQSDCNKSSVR